MPPSAEMTTVTPQDWTGCKILIDHAEVVSFDFFDTLVTRLSASPDAVQNYAGARLEAGDPRLRGFFHRRKEAEDQARFNRPDLGDVDMDMIYAEFSRQTPWADGAGSRALALEVEIDRSFIVPRGDVVQLLRYARAAGKRTIIVSDSYLPVSFLEATLERLGWRGLVDRIYLSSAQFARKETGALWDAVIAQEQVDRRAVIHFGDNPHSDIASAEARGIRAVHLPNTAQLAVDRGIEHAVGEDWRADLLLGPLFARLGADPFGPSRWIIQDGHELGYLAYGPIFLSFFAWLAGHPEIRRMRRLYFAAREGYFLQQMFDTLATEFDIGPLPPTTYLPISRRAVMMAGQALSFDPARVVGNGPFSGPIEDFLNARLGLHLEPADTFAMSIILPDDGDYAEHVLDILEPVIARRSARERDAMIQYARQAGLLEQGPFGLVDIGYSGTIQTGLQDILKRPLTGFYMATSNRITSVKAAGGQAYGCFQNALQDAGAGDGFMPKTVLLEALLTAPHGQLSRFQLNSSGEAEPVYLPGGKSQDRYSQLLSIFEGGLDYCRDSLNAIGPGGLEVISTGRPASFRGLDAIIEGRIAIAGNLKDALYLEDAFCGNGEIPGLGPR